MTTTIVKAKTRLIADLSDMQDNLDQLDLTGQPPLGDTDGGQAFDMLNDAILDSAPDLQEVTRDDGATDEAIEQDLLNDDLPVAR